MALDRIEFGGQVFAMTYDFSRLERNFCKTAGLYPGQPRILTILEKHEGVTLSELSPLCSIGMPSLSVSVRNLQKSGLIQKSGSGKNQKIYLTNTGRERALAFHREIDAFYVSLYEKLGTHEVEQLQQALGLFDQYIRDFNQQYESAHGWQKK